MINRGRPWALPRAATPGAPMSPSAAIGSLPAHRRAAASPSSIRASAKVPERDRGASVATAAKTAVEVRHRKRLAGRKDRVPAAEEAAEARRLHWQADACRPLTADRPPASALATGASMAKPRHPGGAHASGGAAPAAPDFGRRVIALRRRIGQVGERLERRDPSRATRTSSPLPLGWARRSSASNSCRWDQLLERAGCRPRAAWVATATLKLQTFRAWTRWGCETAHRHLRIHVL